MEQVTVYQLNSVRTDKYYYSGQFKHGKIYDGISTLFNMDHDIIYQGKIKDGYRDGKGISYDFKGEKEFEGIWKEDYIYNGTQYSNGKKLFEGEFKIVKDSSAFSGKRVKPWDGAVNNYDISYEVKDFTGEIRSGIPYTGYGHLLHLDYDGKTFKEYTQIEEQTIERAEDEAENPREPSLIEIEEWAKDNNDEARKDYQPHTEYIKADWEQKEVTAREANEININIYNARGERVTNH
ncbi:hypothetical protein FPL02_20700 [Bacillus paranthracis]|nr:hypothetical protein FPL02_20700 [Bacillus paranthracis]